MALKPLRKRVGPLQILKNLIEAPPDEWFKEEENRQRAVGLMVPVECTDYRTLTNAWRKALKWTDALDCTLSAILSTVFSTSFFGDQIWLRVIGPPGSAKSTLCEAVCINKKFTFPISIQTGLHSGYKADGESTEDSSLIPKMNNKIVVIKDGDTLLNSANLGQTLSELRDIYDGVTRAHYRNKKESMYEGLRITFLIAGTKSLLRLNKSYVGDRFLDTIIYDRAHNQDHDLEQSILNRAAYNALERLRSGNNTASAGLTKELIEAYQFTGGYVTWLREQAPNLVASIDCPDSILNLCKRLGEFVAALRARPDKEQQEEQQEAELATRLTSQFVRMANCQAVVMNKTSIDKEVVRRLKLIALQTSRGVCQSIVHKLYDSTEGMDVRQLAIELKRSEPNIRSYCMFLQELKVIRHDSLPAISGAQGRNRTVWSLSYTMKRLCDLVWGE